MLFLKWFGGGVLVALLYLLLLANHEALSETIRLRYYAWDREIILPSLPLYYIVLGSFIGGMFFAIYPSVLLYLRQRRRLRNARWRVEELHKKESQLRRKLKFQDKGFATFFFPKKKSKAEEPELSEVSET